MNTPIATPDNAIPQEEQVALVIEHSKLISFYQEGKYEEACQLIIDTLKHFEKTLYITLSQEIQLEIMFLFLQLVERQVLLFDAIERAAGKELIGKESEQLLVTLKNELPKNRSIRVVLTAHPTQFYPEVLLGLIKDITTAVHKNHVGRIRKLLKPIVMYGRSSTSSVTVDRSSSRSSTT